MSKVSDNLQDVINSAATDANPGDITTSSLRVNINKFENSGTMLNAKLMLLSPAANEEYHKIKLTHSMETSSPLIPIGELSYDVKGIELDEAVKQVTEFT